MAERRRASAVRTVTLDGLPSVAGEGGLDVDAVVAALRRLGRTHRFASPADVPGGTGWDILVPATGRVDRVTADTFGELDAVLGPPESDRAGEPGPHQLVGGYVIALPYELGIRAGATAFLEPIDVVVGIRDGQVRVSGLDEAVSTVLEALDRPARPTAVQPSEPGVVAESLGRDRFETAVRRVQERIADGDVYVANLTEQLTTTYPGDVHQLFSALSQRSPAPHGAVLELTPGAGIASVSPETFLRAEGRELTIRPIKGTRPRHRSPDADRAAAEELRTSPKERAENVMIVDLERNDLGQVCEIGTVEVPELYAVEAHPTVWQLVSTVRGQLRADLGYASALAACFPCGSVTGAPKRSAMGVIDELEPVPRGWYCGTVGWVAPGAMSTAVTIRSAVLRRDATVSYGTGSGIVADSDPAAEYEEARLKADTFLAVTGSVWSDRRDVRSRGVPSDLS